jgi:hypothetical protein
MREKAESYALDGQGLIIPGIFPLESVAKHYHVSPLEYIPPDIHPVSREIDESNSMTVKEKINYGIQSVASVSRDAWQYLWDREAVVFGNTGRPNKRPWVDLTMRTLVNGNLHNRFEDVFFRPEGVSGIESKGAAILELTKEFKNVTHYDIDPWIIFGLAKVFPDVSFVLVQDDNPGILMTREELARFPNVSRVLQLKYSTTESP